MVEVISYGKVVEHDRLCERLAALSRVAAKSRAIAPSGSASPLLAAVTAALLADVYGLVSRDPITRAFPRLDPDQRLRHERLGTVLLDAQLALELFRDAHLDHDDETGDEWLTIEGLEQFGSRRNLSPSLRPPL